MTELREEAESVWKRGLSCRGWQQNGENSSKFLLFFITTIDGIISIIIIAKVFYINTIASLAITVIPMTAYVQDNE